MIQRVDNISFGIKKYSLLSSAKKSKNALTEAQVKEFNQEMQKVASEARSNAAKAWISAGKVICGPNTKVQNFEKNSVSISNKK